MQTNIRTVLGTLLLVTVFGAAYYGLSYVDFFASARLTKDDVDRQTLDIEQDLLTQLNDLNSISLSGDVFKSPEFLSLVDISVALERPAVNRTNPFSGL